MIYSGVIGRISEKPWKDKVFYSFILNGQEGWFSSGMTRPKPLGTTVKFNAELNQKGFNEVKGLVEVLSDGAVGVAPSAVQAVAKAGGTGNSNGAYWDRKEARDLVNDAAREVGASRNTAISFIDLALKHEVVKLPAAAKREEYLWALLDRYTSRLMGKEVEKKEAAPVEVEQEKEGEWN